MREVAEASGIGLILYLKEEGSFGSDKTAGLDAVGRLVDSGVCVGIKYAVVRPDPLDDPYLKALLERVDRRFVISGMGERPAVAHMKSFDLPGFTTGSGCLAPALSQGLYEACVAKDWTTAEDRRRPFLPLEDQRDAWGPARVLHAALELAGVATTGGIPPFVTAISDKQRAELEPTAKTLLAREKERAGAAAGARR